MILSRKHHAISTHESNMSEFKVLQFMLLALLASVVLIFSRFSFNVTNKSSSCKIIEKIFYNC